MPKRPKPIPHTTNHPSLSTYLDQVRAYRADGERGMFAAYGVCVVLERHRTLWADDYGGAFWRVIRDLRLSWTDYTAVKRSVAIQEVTAEHFDVIRVVFAAPGITTLSPAQQRATFNTVVSFLAEHPTVPLAQLKRMARREIADRGYKAPYKKPASARQSDHWAVKVLLNIVAQGHTTRPEYKIALRALREHGLRPQTPQAAGLTVVNTGLQTRMVV